MSEQTEHFRQRDDFGNFDANVLFIERTGAVSPQAKILEIGSGKGRLLSHFVRLGYDIRGVEVNPAFIAEGRALYGDLPVQAVGSTTLPAADETFDVVMSFDVLEHIPDPDAHLREVSRVLKPGGYYLLQTPNKWTNAVFETIRWRSLSSWKAEHCSLHTYGDIKRRFRKHGFTVAFHDIPLVTEFFRRKVRAFLGPFGLFLLAVANPDRFPLPLRTNFYVAARKEGRGVPRA